jgi:hypothetical protein
MCMIFYTGRVRRLVPSPTMADSYALREQVGQLHAVAAGPISNPIRAVCGEVVHEVEGDWTPGAGLAQSWCRECRARTR